MDSIQARLQKIVNKQFTTIKKNAYFLKKVKKKVYAALKLCSISFSLVIAMFY